MDAIHDICDQILREQRESIGGPEFQPAEVYLKQTPRISSSKEHAVDIIFNEFVLRLELADGEVTQEEYYDRFPEYTDQLKRQFLIYFGADQISELVDSQASFENISIEDPDSRFELKEKLGEGGFAVVYKAWDTQLKRWVAIKIARHSLSADSRQFQRFVREAKSAARLAHPSIVSVYQFGIDDDRPFIVNELIDGGTLAQRLDSESTIPGWQITQWLIPICEAVDYAHQLGVIHRDIKPANILFDQFGKPYLADFGLASLNDSELTLTQIGDLLGTPAYMSPEQCQGNTDPGPLSDVYSLGVVMYQMICGRLPFEGKTASVIQRKIHSEPEQPRALIKGVAVDLETICLKAMSRSPSNRYSSAHEMAAELRRFEHGEPILARPVGAYEKFFRLVRRYPLVSTLATLSILLATFLLGGSWQYLDVLSERNRATEAQRESQRLLSEEAASAGNLAMRRGQTKLATQHFSTAIERGYEPASAIHLEAARAEIINTNFDNSLRHLDSISNNAHTATIELLKNHIALLQGNREETNFNHINENELNPADRCFLRGLKSENSRESLSCFLQALEEDTYHHGARRMVALVAMSLADFDFVIQFARVSRQLFPDDNEFALLEALASAAIGDLELSQGIISDCLAEDKSSNQWIQFVRFIHFVCQDLDSGGDAVFLSNRSDGKGLNYDELFKLIKEFRADYEPLLKDRHWVLPPEIARRFKALFDLDQIAIIQEVESKIEIELAQAHEEGTLNSVIARRLVEYYGKDLESLLLIQNYFATALTANSYLHDTKEHARKGAFSVALTLELKYKHEVESNSKLAIELLDSIEPRLCDELNLLRYMTIYSLQKGRYDLGAKFAPRWVEIALREKDADSKESVDALWHQALIYENQKEWYRLLEACNHLLKLRPNKENWQGVFQPLHLRYTAVGELVASLDIGNTRFVWATVIQSAVLHDDWKLADMGLQQWERQNEVAELPVPGIERYRKLVDNAKSGQHKELLAQVQEMINEYGDRQPHELITRLHEKAKRNLECP